MINTREVLKLQFFQQTKTHGHGQLCVDTTGKGVGPVKGKGVKYRVMASGVDGR